MLNGVKPKITRPNKQITQCWMDGEKRAENSSRETGQVLPGCRFLVPPRVTSL